MECVPNVPRDLSQQASNSVADRTTTRSNVPATFYTFSEHIGSLMFRTGSVNIKSRAPEYSKKTRLKGIAFPRLIPTNVNALHHIRRY